MPGPRHMNIRNKLNIDSIQKTIFYDRHRSRMFKFNVFWTYSEFCQWLRNVNLCFVIKRQVAWTFKLKKVKKAMNLKLLKNLSQKAKYIATRA